MSRQPITVFIRQLSRPIFTTRELAALSGKSLSTTTQALKLLERKGLILKVCRGIWAEAGDGRVSAYAVTPFLLPEHRVYVSFVSALHLYGLIEQIPQVVTLASTAHTKIIHTKIATFSIHQITPRFFDGFHWYKGTGNFLIAEQEKALIDTLYLSACKKKQFRYFPELYLRESFSFRKARKWAKRIPDVRISSYVQTKLETLRNEWDA